MERLNKCDRSVTLAAPIDLDYYETDNTYVVDTPGIRQFMLWDIIPEEVSGFFRDLHPFENLCHYPDCTHTHENFCAVKDGVADGKIDLRRYDSYLAIRESRDEA